MIRHVCRLYVKINIVIRYHTDLFAATLVEAAVSYFHLEVIGPPSPTRTVVFYPSSPFSAVGALLSVSLLY